MFIKKTQIETLLLIITGCILFCCLLFVKRNEPDIKINSGSIEITQSYEKNDSSKIYQSKNYSGDEISAITYYPEFVNLAILGTLSNKNTQQQLDM